MATFITPINISPGVTGSFQDVDLSSYIPVGSTGVMLHVVNSSGVTATFGLQKNGSTDNRTNDISTNYHTWAAMGVDTNRILEIYTSTTDLQIWLIGYFGSEAVFFTNGISKTPSGAWADVSIAADTGADTAIGAIFEISGAGSWYFGARKNGSTDNRVDNIDDYYAFSCIVGVDASEICEVYKATQSLYLTGYIKSNAFFNTNATDISLTPTGAWTDLSALPIGAIGAIIEQVNGGALSVGLRKNGSSENIYLGLAPHVWAFVECDSGGIVEGKIAATTSDFFLAGYFLSILPVAEFSGSPLSGNKPLSVIFTDLSYIPTSWLWEYSKDGGAWISFSTVQNPTFVFNSSGLYSIRLSVTNAEGSDSETKLDYIQVTSSGGSIDVQLPSLKILAGTNDIISTFPQLESLLGTNDIVAILPSMIAGMGGYWTDILKTRFPSLRFTGLATVTHNVIQATFPSLTFTGITAPWGDISATFPALTMSGIAGKGEVGEIDVILPRMIANIIGSVWTMGQIEAVFPYLKGSLTGLTGRVGTIDATLPMLKAFIQGLWTLAVSGNLSALFPSLTFTSLGNILAVLEDYAVYVMNLKNFGITKYTNFNFNSFCKVGDLYLAIGDTGIHLLGGNKDNGSAINARFKTGLMDFGIDKLKRITDIVIEMEAGGSYELRLTTSEGKEVTIPFSDADMALHPIEVDGARGIKGTYWDVEFRNILGSDFEIDTIKPILEILSRRK